MVRKNKKRETVIGKKLEPIHFYSPYSFISSVHTPIPSTMLSPFPYNRLV